MTLPFWLTYLGSYFAVSAGVYTLFSRTDDIVTDETRSYLSNSLFQAASSPGFWKWPGTFNVMFDAIYGDKHLSMRCFVRSAITTLLVVLSLSFHVLPKYAVHGGFFSLEETRWQATGYMLIWAVLWSILPDYLVLLKSRVYLQKLYTSKRTAAILICDLFLSLFISISAVIAITIMIDGLQLCTAAQDSRFLM